MKVLLKRYALERTVQLAATPLPITHPRRRLYFLLGLGLGVAIPVVFRPAPQPAVTECPAPPFELPAARDLKPGWDVPVMPPELLKRWQPGGDLYAKYGPLQDLSGGAPPTPTPLEDTPHGC